MTHIALMLNFRLIRGFIQSRAVRPFSICFLSDLLPGFDSLALFRPGQRI
jgi:hypothetical protein